MRQMKRKKPLSIKAVPTWTIRRVEIESPHETINDHVTGHPTVVYYFPKRISLDIVFPVGLSVEKVGTLTVNGVRFWPEISLESKL